MNYPLDIICHDKEENGATRAKPRAVDWIFAPGAKRLAPFIQRPGFQTKLGVCLCVRDFRDFPRRTEVPVTFNDSLHLSRVCKNGFQKKSQDFDHPGQRYVSRGTPVLSSFWSTFSQKVKTATSQTSEITLPKLCIGKRIKNAGPRERHTQALSGCGSHLDQVFCGNAISSK